MVELIRWPESAKVDRVIPKERLYAEARATTALKQRFVDEVQRVHWAYKLGEESVRLAPGAEVTEIQVFVIDLKGAALDNAVLASIDRSIPSEIVFELRRADGLWVEQAMTAAHKRSRGRTNGADYYRSGWVGADDSRHPLPAAVDMDGLYAALLGRLLPHPIRPGEHLSAALDRMNRTRRIGREINALEKKMRSEPQFNRKLELRKQIKDRAAVLTKLANPVPDDKG